jgi:hypothetical protein
MVFGAAVFDVSTSAWVASWSVGFVAGCGCNVCGMCVTWVVVWAVVGTCSSTAWDEPSGGSSFLSQFLGGILWVFFQAHKRWASMLGLDCRRLLGTNKGGAKKMDVVTRHVASGTESLVNQSPPPRIVARAGLFIVRAQQSYYNTLKVPNHLPHK